MSRVHPDSSEDPASANGVGRFTRYSAWSLSPEHEECDAQLPVDTELAEVPSAQRLVYYFDWLTDRSNLDIKLSYLEQLINNEGADISAQHHGSFFVCFSAMHYTAAQWDVSIAEFLVSKGIRLDCPSNEGATPLHIASYSNHTDMIEYLLDNGVDPNCRAKTLQTPAHFAVRGDAVEALDKLIEGGACYTKSSGGSDYRGRTPLQLAAELDRDNVVLFLLSIERLPAHCSVVDKFGHPVLSTMIASTPQLASLALNQFHRVYPAERYQEFRLHRVESALHATKTPFETIVESKEYNVLVHPVMKKLIEEKWKHSARWLCLLYFCIDALFVLVWTVQYAYPSIQSKHQYNFPTDIWRVVLWIIGIALLVVQISQEILEFASSYHRNRRYKTWLERRIRDDIANCSRCSFFNAERVFLERNLDETKHVRARYFTDAWNYLDIAAYLALIVEFILHIFDIVFHSEVLALFVGRVGALSVILIWVRLLYYARASGYIGPMVAIIGQLSRNIAQYFLIISVISIPYGVSFWVLFGGEQQTMANITDFSNDLTHPHRVAVMLFRMVIVDDYPYDVLRSIDELTSTILVISFLFITAVISLNLFIALLSDTFQRVYDNARANAEMQKAQLILSMQNKGGKLCTRKFLAYINEKCAPLREYYDDDEGGGESSDISLTKITHQIHKLVKRLSENEEEHGNQIRHISEAIGHLEQQIASISSQVDEMKKTLSTQSTEKVAPPVKLPDIQTSPPALLPDIQARDTTTECVRRRQEVLEPRNLLKMVYPRGTKLQGPLKGPWGVPISPAVPYYQGHRKLQKSSSSKVMDSQRLKEEYSDDEDVSVDALKR